MKKPLKEKKPAAPDAGQPPEQDPMLGDKTPEFVEWLRDHDPEEFARRYKDRRTHLGWHN